MFNISELRQLLKVSRDALRKNHYQHMHSRPAVAEESSTIEQTASEAADKKQSHRYGGENGAETKSSRMQDVQSELQVRHNSTTDQYSQQQVVGNGKTRALARNVISSKD